MKNITSEDWPLFLELIRNEYIPEFLDKVVTKHSMAGVCNYNLANSIAVKKRFYDKYFMVNAEVKPYFDLLEPLDKKAYYKYMDRWMNRVYIMECSYKYCSKKRSCI